MTDTDTNKKRGACNLPPTLQHAVYRDWGITYKKKQLWDKSTKWFTKSSELDNTDYIPFLEKSKCKLENFLIKDAHEDVQKALKLKPENNYKLHHQNIDCLFDLNQFENGLKECHNAVYRNNSIVNQKEIKRRFLTISECFECAVGTHAGPCLFNMRNQIKKLEKQDEVKLQTDGPLWKLRKEQGLCDVVSYAELTKHKPVPILRHQIKQNMKVLSEIFFERSHYDYTFLRQLLEDDRLNLEQTVSTKEIIKDIDKNFSKIRICEEILRTRRPMYAKEFAKTGKSKISQEFKESIECRSQLHTRNDVFYQLAKVRQLHRDKKIKQLLIYVLNIIEKYYAITPNKLFPRKFEFVSELINIVGVVYIERLIIPTDLVSRPLLDQLCYLLQIKRQEKTEITFDAQNKILFGDRDAFESLNTIDYSFVKYKTQVARLEQLLSQANYPIELCYFYYEIAELHLSQHKPEEVRIITQKIIDAGEKCGNWVWQFLGCLVATKIAALQNTSRRILEKVEQMEQIAQHLGEKMQHFMRTTVLIATAYVQEVRLEEQKEKEALEREEELRILKKQQFLRKSV